jgi:FAD/FMN-containing dehydrogenase
LIELANFDLDDALIENRVQQLLERTLEKYLDSGGIHDAVIAQTQAQVQDFWGIRHHITLAQAKEAGNIKFDISFAISKLLDLLHRPDNILQEHFPGIQIINFGHLGDGNLHYNVCAPIGASKEYVVEREGHGLRKSFTTKLISFKVRSQQNMGLAD